MYHSQAPFETPSIEELNAPVGPLGSGAFEGAVAEQLEAEDHFAFQCAKYEIAERSSCRHCGRFTSGTSMAGQNVMICDDCLINLVVGFDRAKVAEVLAATV